MNSIKGTQPGALVVASAPLWRSRGFKHLDGGGTHGTDFSLFLSFFSSRRKEKRERGSASHASRSSGPEASPVLGGGKSAGVTVGTSDVVGQRRDTAHRRMVATYRVGVVAPAADAPPGLAQVAVDAGVEVARGLRTQRCGRCAGSGSADRGRAGVAEFLQWKGDPMGQKTQAVSRAVERRVPTKTNTGREVSMCAAEDETDWRPMAGSITVILRDNQGKPVHERTLEGRWLIGPRERVSAENTHDFGTEYAALEGQYGTLVVFSENPFDDDLPALACFDQASKMSGKISENVLECVQDKQLAAHNRLF